MNNLYEFGGSCDVIIRCKSERYIGGRHYKENEPYTLLQDVMISLQYKNITSGDSAKNNIIATRQGLPDNVSITNVSLTDKIACLIAEKVQSQKIGKTYCGIAENNTIYLPEIPLNDSVFIYNRNQRLDKFTIDKDKIIGDFVDSESYLIFYDIMSDSSCFDFNTPHYGYFTLEIIGKGNKDKVSKDIYIKLPAVSLMSVPIFDLVDGNILHAPLQFQIIHQNQPKPYFNIGG